MSLNVMFTDVNNLKDIVYRYECHQGRCFFNVNVASGGVYKNVSLGYRLGVLTELNGL